MKRRFSLVIMALCAIISFSSLHAADPDPYQNKVEKDDFTSFNPSGNFSMQVRLAVGESVEARNADAKGFVYKAEKPGVYSFLVDVTSGTVSVYWGPTLETEIPVTTSDSYFSIGGEDLVNAEIQDQSSRRGIYDVRNLITNPGLESVQVYENSPNSGIPDNWTCLDQGAELTSRAIDVSTNTTYDEMRPLVEGDWVFMYHNKPNPVFQEIGTLEPSTWYKVNYRQHAHGDTSPSATYTHYISADSAVLAEDGENLIASHTYMSAPQGYGNYVEVKYAFKTPASLPSKLFYVVNRGSVGCINHLDRMTLMEITENDVLYYGIDSDADEITWQDGLQAPQGGSNEIYEDVTDQYFVNPSFEETPINQTLAPNSNSATEGNGPIYQPQGWTIAYSAKLQSPDMWDQGLVTSGQSAEDKSKNPPASSDTGFRPDDGEYFYYFRTRWTANQDFEISQKLSSLPAGRYDLTLAAAADETSPAMIKVSGAAAKTTQIAEISMKTYSLALNLVNGGDVTVSVSLERLIDAQARLALDNFRLIYRGEPDIEEAIDDYVNIVESLREELLYYDRYSVPSGVYADWIEAENLYNQAVFDETVDAWSAAALKYTKLLEDVKASTPLYFRLYDLYEEAQVEIGKTNLSGKAVYEEAAENALNYLFYDNPNMIYAAELEEAIEEFLEARKAYYYTAFADATTSTAKEVTYAIDYTPYFTVYGGDISNSADRTKGNWLTDNNPAEYAEYKLHTINGYNCWNNWNNNFSKMDLYQEITGLPEGMYSVSAYTTTNTTPNDQHAYITTMAGTSESPAATYMYEGSENFTTEAEWENVQTGRVYLPAGGTLRIGFASTSGGGSSGWFCATGFQLYYTKATPEDAKTALDIKIKEAEDLLDSASVKVMGVEKAALNAAINSAKVATGDEIVAAFVPLNDAIEGANASILAYNKMYVTLVEAKVLLAETEYSQEAKDALSAVITEQEEIIAASTTDATMLPAVQNELLKAIAAYKASSITIPDDVSPENPYDLTRLLVNPEIEAEGDTSDVEGWTIVNSDGDKNSTTGQHYSGDLTNRYLDSWNASAGALKFTATQSLVGIPNGTYRLTVVARTSGEGSYLYANGSQVFTTEIEAFGSEGGPIYEEAEEDSDIKLANEGKGWGWQYVTVDNINVNENMLTVGITNDPSVSNKKAWTGTWYSADEFKLYLISTDFYGVGIEDVNADDSSLIVYAENGYIIVEGVEDFKVNTLSGATVPSNAQLAPGFYIVTAGGKSAKVVVR